MNSNLFSIDYMCVSIIIGFIIHLYLFVYYFFFLCNLPCFYFKYLGFSFKKNCFKISLYFKKNLFNILYNLRNFILSLLFKILVLF